VKFNTYRAQFLVDYLDLPNASGVADARWEFFQLNHLNDDSVFRIEMKSRQIAWSWVVSAEAVADAILDKRDTIIVSINQDEAMEKIRYASQVIDSLPLKVRPEIVSESKTGIELANGARIRSLPARPPRGRARSNLVLDEFAHVRNDRIIYQAAIPIVSKGGRIRIGSSPMGASGMFYDIFTQQTRRYPNYKRQKTPWWYTYAFTENLPEAIKLADNLSTADRVEKFGSKRLQEVYEAMLLDDFRQEYETEVVDENRAWITWDEIRNVQDENLMFWHVSGVDSNIDKALSVISTVADASRSGKIEKRFVVGVDIGRQKNATEIFVSGMAAGRNQVVLRLAISMTRCDFASQETVLMRLMELLPVTQMNIDRTGLGMNLAENMELRWPSKIEGVDFTNAAKKEWATNVKMAMNQKLVIIPVWRDFAYQIHSIKRKVTQAKNLIFDTEASELHHADMFWAWSIGVTLGISKPEKRRIPIVSRSARSNWAAVA